MQSVTRKKIESGIAQFDLLIQELRLGDNVVWQLDRIEDYTIFAEAFMDQAIDDGYDCVYIRFSPHPEVIRPRNGLTVIEVDPSQGFDSFSGEVYRIIERRGEGVCYIFDNISTLVEEWATDELLANFFHATCPHLLKLNAVAYFALTRGQHAQSAVTRIRNVTQIFIDIYHVSGDIYVHPLKVWGRYSPQMFLPYKMNSHNWEPISRSGEAANLLSTASRHPIHIGSDSIAPWESTYRELLRIRNSKDYSPELTGEVAVLKGELTRMMVGNHKKLNNLCDRFMSLDDLLHIRERLIGSGRIGGKAAGMLMARSVLLCSSKGTDFSRVLEEHDSFYIGSDVFFTFLVNNDLFRLRLDLSNTGKLSWNEFAEIEQRFLAGSFPEDIMEQFRNMLNYYGQAPIIVRSSSLLEDGFSDTFAGKYRSEFCANQGNPDNRMEEFLKAIKLVYASALNPDALSYRHKRGLEQDDEQMAILVQRVSGMPFEDYFFPTLAGVAFSRNLYAWTDRIDPKKGMVRLVFGLGTRAVNRVSGDYPRMIAISHPELRPEVGMQVSKYSQRNVDVLNISDNTFETIPLVEIIGGSDYPNINLFISEISDGYPVDFVGPLSAKPVRNPVLTFNNLIRRTGLVGLIGEIVARLEEEWGQPIDIEFTAYVEADEEVRINLLQCRSLQLPKTAGKETIAIDDLSGKEVLFHSDRAINAGVVSDIRYIVYIDPSIYTATPIEIKKSLGRVIGKLHDVLSKREGRAMAIGPGRWGSSNIDLGVNVSYADINSFAVLVEVAREEAGLKPEVSYGTHFFQDLVEADILYMPVYPGDESAQFNEHFFGSSPSILRDLLPEAHGFEEVLRVIDVAGARNATAMIVADPHTRNATCFINK